MHGTGMKSLTLGITMEQRGACGQCQEPSRAVQHYASPTDGNIAPDEPAAMQPGLRGTVTRNALLGQRIRTCSRIIIRKTGSAAGCDRRDGDLAGTNLADVTLAARPARRGAARWR